MRVAVTATCVCLFLLAAPAAACPKPCLRVTKLTIKPVTLELEPKREHETAEMPWIWRVLRERVYRRLPRYERRKMSLVVSPVVVNSPADTVPGVGVAGGF